jgi:translation initiation factor IF-1
MPSDSPKFEGIIDSAKGNGFFLVNIPLENGKLNPVICQLSGKMRTNNIKIVKGDHVDVELDPYNMLKGRIIYRRK